MHLRHRIGRQCHPCLPFRRGWHYLVNKREGGGIGFAAVHDLGPSEPSGLIWMHDEAGDGDPDEVIEFVLRCTRRFELGDYWGFVWSHSCSRLRVNSFGGGACLLDLGTGRVAADPDCMDWLDNELQKTRRFFIHSKAEAQREKGSGWWSTDFGWDSADQATIFMQEERHAFDRPLIFGNEARWHELLPGRTVATSTKKAIAMES